MSEHETVIGESEHDTVQAEPAENDQARQTLEELQEKLAAAEDKAQENWEALLRARAELDNLRKRAQRDIENAHKYGLEKIAQELLAVVDSMEMGLQAAEEVSANVNSLREGHALTYKMLEQLLEKFGINAINPLNSKFDPNLHQAMSMQPSERAQPGTVMQVMQKGYTLNERLLRPALVVVAKAAEPPENNENQPQ